MWDLSLFSEAERSKKFERKKEQEESIKELFEKFHLKRIPAEIRVRATQIGVPPVVIAARILSSDFTANRARFYVKEKIIAEKEISFTILENERLYIRGTVQWCRRDNIYSCVRSKDPFPFRIEVKFDFESLIEKENIRQYSDRFYKRFVMAGPPHPRSGKLI